MSGIKFGSLTIHVQMEWKQQTVFVYSIDPKGAVIRYERFWIC